MITFVQDNASLFGEEFSLLDTFCYDVIPEAILKNAFIGVGYNNIYEFHYKKGYGVEDIANWKSTHDGVGIATFENSDGKKFALRLDLLPNAPAQFGRQKFKDKLGNAKLRVSIPYSEEIRNRNVEIEHIVGFFILQHRNNSNEYVFLVIVEIIPNAQRVSGITASIAFQMGKILSDVHKAGVIHGHPHLGNWVLVNGKPRLVDGKGVLLDVDFPWHTCTGRIHTFQKMASNDCAHILFGELGTNPENFDAFNDGCKTI